MNPRRPYGALELDLAEDSRMQMKIHLRFYWIKHSDERFRGHILLLFGRDIGLLYQRPESLQAS